MSPYFIVITVFLVASLRESSAGFTKVNGELEPLQSAHLDVFINSLLDQEALKKSAFHEGLTDGLQKETITANLKGISDYMNDQLKEKEAMRSLIWTVNHIIANAQEALEKSDVVKGEDQVRYALTLFYQLGENFAQKLARARQQQVDAFDGYKAELLKSQHNQAQLDRLLGRIVERASLIKVQ